jgi:hypothetical protein
MVQQLCLVLSNLGLRLQNISNMSVYAILQRAGRKIGLNPTDTNQRSTLLRWLNEGAREVYSKSDMPGSLWEHVFKINGDQSITCPHYVDQVRAAREYDSQVAWSINQMRPRYNQFNWTDMWRNLRLKNKQCLQATVTNTSTGRLTVEAVENPPVSVVVRGQTIGSTNTSETVVMTETTMFTKNQYSNYEAFKKDSINLYDITLTDMDGNILSVLPNNQFEARYSIIDVSSCPWLSISTSTLDHYLELLYKRTLPILWWDTDDFLDGTYDDILVDKIQQIWNEEQGKVDIAMAFDTKATRSLAERTENVNRATEDVVSLVANPHDVILPRIRQGRRKYYRGYGSRGYGY